MKEIERKFILKKLPIFKSGVEIQQLLQYYYKKEGDSNW
jgi:hypothetical protein